MKTGNSKNTNRTADRWFPLLCIHFGFSIFQLIHQVHGQIQSFIARLKPSIFDEFNVRGYMAGAEKNMSSGIGLIKMVI